MSKNIHDKLHSESNIQMLLSKKFKSSVDIADYEHNENTFILKDQVGLKQFNFSPEV